MQEMGNAVCGAPAYAESTENSHRLENHAPTYREYRWSEACLAQTANGLRPFNEVWLDTAMNGALSERLSCIVSPNQIPFLVSWVPKRSSPYFDLSRICFIRSRNTSSMALSRLYLLSSMLP